MTPFAGFSRWLAALLLVALTMSGPLAHAAEQTAVVVSAKGRTVINIELADDDKEREQGLMYRTSLAENAGMLFDFGPERQVTMWMKNTLIPLDMIFIDKRGKIVGIAHNARPKSLKLISPGVKIKSVLEVKGGTAIRLGWKTGDRVEHPIFTAPK